MYSSTSNKGRMNSYSIEPINVQVQASYSLESRPIKIRPGIYIEWVIVHMHKLSPPESGGIRYTSVNICKIIP